MKYLLAILLSLPLTAEIICLPYSDAALKALQAEPTAQSGVTFGIPAIETSKTGRRMCFAHPFATTDELTGLKRPSDLKWAQTKVEAVAVTAGIAASKDAPATITTKVQAVVKSTAALPAGWEPLKTGEVAPDLAPIKVVAPIEKPPVEEVKVIK